MLGRNEPKRGGRSGKRGRDSHRDWGFGILGYQTRGDRVGGTTRDSVRSRGQKRVKGRKEDRRKKEGKKGKREGEKEMYRGGGRERKREIDQGRQRSKTPGGCQPSAPTLLAWQRGRPCWEVGTGRRLSPGRRVECLYDVFIP